MNQRHGDASDEDAETPDYRPDVRFSYVFDRQRYVSGMLRPTIMPA